MIGTVALRLAGHEIPAAMTTPMPADLPRLLSELDQYGGTDLVIEASSHALAQGRTDPVRFDSKRWRRLLRDGRDGAVAEPAPVADVVPIRGEAAEG